MAGVVAAAQSTDIEQDAIQERLQDWEPEQVVVATELGCLSARSRSSMPMPTRLPSRRRK